MSLTIKSPKDYALAGILFLFFLLIPCWNIPHTIGIRYIAAVLISLICIANYKHIALKLNKPQILWIVFLLSYPIFISDWPWLTVHEFKGEWYKAIGFILIGHAVASLIKEVPSKKIILILGVASAVPVFIFYIYFIKKYIEIGQLPYRYWGIHEHHADLGYTSIQAIFFLTIYTFISKNKFINYLCYISIALLLITPTLIQSRSGLIFSSLSLILAYLLSKLTYQRDQIKLSRIIVALILLTPLAFYSIHNDPSRWQGVIDRLSVGMLGNPIEINCHGIPNDLNKKEGDAINSLNSGDGARIMTARAGIILSLENVWGYDGRKDAYDYAIRQKCPSPAIDMNHTHNGWIDTALSIGIVGMLLYLVLIVYYGISAWDNIKQRINNPWSISLLSLSLIWIIRACFDSVQRDQMLELQCFFMALCYRLSIEKPSTISNSR